MRTLRFVALSDDGASLVVTVDGESEEEQRFELPLDDRLLAATRVGSRRLDLVDDDQGTRLPPRVIQSRIRAGESPEQVSQSSGMRLERVQRFARPVLQERERITEQAREARVRLTGSETAAALQQFIAERLRLLGVDLDVVRWDAARGADAVWHITAAWSAGPKSGTTRWLYDVPGRAVSPADAATTDFAEGTRLVRVVPEVPAGAPPVSVLRPRPVSMPDAEPHTENDPDPTSDVGTDASPPPESGAWTPAEIPGPPSSRPAVDLVPDLDEIAEHDTLVIDRPIDEHRTPVPAWEDIVFGLRRRP